MLDGTLSSTVDGATKEVGRAYGIIMGLVWVTALPSVGYYVAFVSPIKLSKRAKFFTAAGAAVLSVILDIVFFVTTKNYRPTTSGLFRLPWWREAFARSYVTF